MMVYKLKADLVKKLKKAKLGVEKAHIDYNEAEKAFDKAVLEKYYTEYNVLSGSNLAVDHVISDDGKYATSERVHISHAELRRKAADTLTPRV